MYRNYAFSGQILILKIKKLTLQNLANPYVTKDRRHTKCFLQNYLLDESIKLSLLLPFLFPQTKSIKLRKFARIHSILYPLHVHIHISELQVRQKIMFLGHCHSPTRENRSLGSCPEPWHLVVTAWQTMANLFEVLQLPRVAGAPMCNWSHKILYKDYINFFMLYSFR